MKIIRLESWRVSMRLAEPYAIAYESVERAENLFVRLVTDGKLVGVGCAAPDPGVSGETVSAAAAGLDEAASVLEGADPWRWTALLVHLEKLLAERPAARAALDMALFDLLARRANLPLWKLLGGYRRRIATSVTIGILPLADTVAVARRRVEDGFRFLKLKGGLDPDDDAARVQAVRRAVGEGVGLRFDANQGYTVESAARFLAATRDVGLELLEQPTPAGERRLLGTIDRAAGVGVMADESLRSLADVFQIVRGELAEMINIKLMKVGGLRSANRIASVAVAGDLEVMVGCGDESALGIAAGLAFALSRPGIRFADLDGHLDLEGDPAASAVRLEGGYLYPSDGAGLGGDPAILG